MIQDTLKAAIEEQPQLSRLELGDMQIYRFWDQNAYFRCLLVLNPALSESVEQVADAIAEHLWQQPFAYLECLRDEGGWHAAHTYEEKILLEEGNQSGFMVVDNKPVIALLQNSDNLIIKIYRVSDLVPSPAPPRTISQHNPGTNGL